MRHHDVSTDLLKGCLSGAIATAPMTVAMVAMHRALPPNEKYPLPPSIITENLEQKAGVVDKVDRKEHRALTMASHVGYGALCGGLFALTIHARGRTPRTSTSAASGVLFGLGVWATSYLGLLPALHLHGSAKQIPARRNALMIAAHVVWGAALGLALKALR